MLTSLFSIRCSCVWLGRKIVNLDIIEDILWRYEPLSLLGRLEEFLGNEFFIILGFNGFLSFEILFSILPITVFLTENLQDFNNGQDAHSDQTKHEQQVTSNLRIQGDCLLKLQKGNLLTNVFKEGLSF